MFGCVDSSRHRHLAELQLRSALSDAQLRKVVVALPSVLGYSFESNISPSLEALQSRLALSEAQLRKVVVALPSVLGFSFESNIGPKLDYLQTTVFARRNA